MSARQLATGCALALITLLLAPGATAAPRAPNASKPAAGRAPPARPSRASRPSPPAPAPTLAPAPAPTLAPAPAPTLAPAPAPTLAPAPAPTLAPAPAPALAVFRSLDPTPREQVTPEDPSLHTRFAITLNLLPLVVGRYGGNGEFLLSGHHAIVASAYLQTFSKQMLHVLLPSVDLGEGPASRLGGELGYRFYTGHDGPTGLFLGPSAIAMPIAYPRVTEDLRAEVISFHAYGAALDVGVQAVVGPGFTIGGGVGVMALAYTPPPSASPPAGIQVPAYPEPHVLPRLLMMGGWAF